MRFDDDLRRLEDLDWGLRFGAAGGRLVVQEIAGAKITRSDLTNWQKVAEAGNAIVAKNADLLAAHPDARKALKAYLSYEEASYAIRERRWPAAFASLARTFVAKPRFRRHLSPGWTYPDNLPPFVDGNGSAVASGSSQSGE